MIVQCDPLEVVVVLVITFSALVFPVRHKLGVGPFKAAAGEDGEVFVGLLGLVEPLECLMKVVQDPTPKATTVRIANWHLLF